MRFKQWHWERMQNKKIHDILTIWLVTNMQISTILHCLWFLDCFLSKGVGSSKKFTGVLLCAWVQLICKRRAPPYISIQITHVLKLKKITSDLIHICKPVPSSIQVFEYIFLTFLSSPTRCKFLIKQIQKVYYAEYLRFYPEFMQIKMRICTYFSL